MASTAIYTVNIELTLCTRLYYVFYSGGIYCPGDDVTTFQGRNTLHHYRCQVRICCNNCITAVYVFTVILNCRRGQHAVTHKYRVHTCANTISHTHTRTHAHTQARKCDRLYMNFKRFYCTFIACLFTTYLRIYLSIYLHVYTT